MSKKNVGITDRKIRFALGIIFAVIAVYFGVTGQYLVAGGLTVLTLIAVFTAKTQTCPLYSVTGINTNGGN